MLGTGPLAEPERPSTGSCAAATAAKVKNTTLRQLMMDKLPWFMHGSGVIKGNLRRQN